jgi:hypothetical protein
MNTPRRSRGARSARSGLLAPAVVTAAVVVVVGACVASSPSVDPSAVPSASPGASASPAFTPTVDPDPSPSPLSPPSVTAPAFTPPWEPAGTMVDAMVGPGDNFQSVALTGGRVLVVGPPADAEEPVGPSAELWDPATNAWAGAAGLDRTRSKFALVALRDGRAIAIGGLNGHWGSPGVQSYSSAYAFDPSSETWTKVGLMTTARTAPSAALLPDGRVLVAGGWFHTGSEAAAAAPARDGAAAAVLAAYHPATTTGPKPSRPPLDDIDVAPYGYALATAEIFDPATGEWSATGPMRYARVDAAMMPLTGGRVLVVGSGGTDSVTGVHPDAYLTAELYDPATGRFTMAGRLPAIDHEAVRAMGVRLPEDEGAPGSIGTLVAQPGGGAVLIGNDRWWKHEADIIRSFSFDIGTTTWSEIDRPCASARDDSLERWVVVEGGCRQRELAIGLPDGQVLALGGISLSNEGEASYEPTGDVRLLDPDTGAWTLLPPMPIARESGTAVALRDGSVLVFGGLVDGEYGREAIRYVPSR